MIAYTASHKPVSLRLYGTTLDVAGACGRRHDQMSENVPYARKSCHKRLIECKIYCWNARGEIYLNPVFIFYHADVMARAARDFRVCCPQEAG